MSRNLDLPVIAISSFNRASYNNEENPTMASYKESGAIEYTADVLLSMQFKKGNKGDDINKFKIEEPRLLKLVILKNRRGMDYEAIELEYYTRQNYFTEYLHC